MKALLVAGASLVLAQDVECSMQPKDNCTGVANCELVPGMCYRKFGNTTCDTTSMTACTTMNCANGAAVVDGKTCSKCADSCMTTAMQADNATCLAGADTYCQWNGAYCRNKTMAMPTACSKTTATECTTELGCFWVSVATNQCGVAAAARGFCSQCNSTTYKDARTALKNSVGSTCKWAIVAPYTTAFSVEIKAYSQATDCSAIPTVIDATADNAALGKLAKDRGFWNLLPFDAVAIPAITCTKASGAASLIPSLALLGLIAAVVA